MTEPAGTIVERLSAVDWQEAERALWERGYARTRPLLTDAECASTIALYHDEARFRSRVDMVRYRFGRGEYKYFAAPLPPLVDQLRAHLYPRLAGVANRWMEALDQSERYPPTLAEFLARCHAAGQTQPTPLMLRYEEGGYNCLHQDLYGAVAFPLQVVAFLSQPGADYSGGEFVLVEQRPRAQSAVEVMAGRRGELVMFTTRVRPVAGHRGHYRVNIRHGVSRVHSGIRHTLGIIFHDAK